jgi:hypothetical protein
MPICPECGVDIDLKKVDPIKGHAIPHYGVVPADSHTLLNPVARERYAALLKMKKGVA